MRFREKYRFQGARRFVERVQPLEPGGIDTGIKSANFGQVTSAGGNRNIQAGVRLDF